MHRTKLIFKGVSEIVGSARLAVLILTDEDERRQISIVCDKTSAVQIELRLRPDNVTAECLPEVLSQLLSKLMGARMEILIKDVVDGQYKVLLCSQLDWIEPIVVRASDAILFSIVGNVPVYIDSSLMMRQSVAYKKNAQGVSLPVNTISNDMLQKALEKAVDDENYELASRLRDEINKRGIGKKN